MPKGLLYTTVPTAALILLLKGYTREAETIAKCRAGEGWVTALFPCGFINDPTMTDACV